MISDLKYLISLNYQISINIYCACKVLNSIILETIFGEAFLYKKIDFGSHIIAPVF